MVNYPNGKRNTSKALVTTTNNHSKIEYGKRGMRFEDAIDLANQYYLKHNIAVIHKKPTPIQIVDVDYPKRSRAVIKEAYFRKASTTDYNGVYRGKYIDFEAKATQNKTSFPLINIHDHQVQHMQQVSKHGAICFILFYFSFHDEVFLLPIEPFLKYWEMYKNAEKKSIPMSEIKKYGYHVEKKYQPRIDYLKVIDNVYFNELN